MAQPIRPRPKDRPASVTPKDHVDSSSRERKILPGRRQQRHSTEIGSEYHRWWVVRNVLGFETNEHIAGLLLDSFHSTLQQLVVMNGGEMYDPDIHGLDSLDGQSCSAGDKNSTGTGVSASTPSSSSAASPFSSSPPGFIEDPEEFLYYKSAIGYYCEYLWTVCVQQDRMPLILSNLSPPIQQFLIKLIGYLRAARGRCQSTTHKKRRSRASSSRQAEVDRPQGEPPKPEYTTPQQKDRGFLQSPNVPESWDRKDDPQRHGNLNYQEDYRNSFQNWHPNPLPYREGAEEVCRSHQGLQQQTSERMNIGVNSAFYPNHGNDRNLKDFHQTKDGLIVKQQSPKHWDLPHGSLAHQPFNNRGPQQFKPWESKRVKCDGGGDIQSQRDKMAGQDYPDDGKWKPRGYLSEAAQKDWSSSLKEGKDLSWPEFHGNLTSDKPQGMSTASAPSSCQSSLPGTPRVYLDCDGDQATDADHAVEPFPSVQGDQCLKSLLSRPLKVHPIKTPQFVKDDGSMWQSSQHTIKESDRDRKPSLKPDAQTDKKPENLNSSVNFQNVQKCMAHPQTNPADLSTRPKMRSPDFNENLERCSTSSKGYSECATISTQDCQDSTASSTSPATLVYAGSGNGPPHPLGTPVFFYPAGGFPSTDNSLASLPALVQNIVYNQSGASLLQPLTDHPRTPTASNPFNSGLAMVNRVSAPGSGPAFMPLYMSSHPTLDTLYKPTKAVSTSTGGQSENATVSTSTHTKGSSDVGLNSLPAPSSTQLYQEWTSGSGPQGPPSANKEALLNSSPQFKITDVRSCEDTDFTSGQHWKNGCKVTASHKAWQHEEKMQKDEAKAPFSECQGLSGCKVNIFPDGKDCVASSKSLGYAGYSNTSKNTFASQRDTTSKLSHTSYNKHTVGSSRWESQDSTVQAEFEPSQTLHSESPKNITRKRQGSNASFDELPGYFQANKIQAPSVASSSLHGSGSQSKPSQKVHCQPSDASDISCKDPKPKKPGPASKSQAPAPLAWPSNRSTSRRHICQSCELVFPSGTDLLLHRYEQHSLVCGECDSRFLSTSGLLRHKETDHPPISRCQHCRFVTFSRNELASHMISEHGADVEKSKDSERSSDEFNQKRANSGGHAIPSDGNMTVSGNCKAEPAADDCVSTHGNAKAHTAREPTSPLLQQEGIAAQACDASSGSDQFSSGHASHQDCVEHHDAENTGSESEEPCLVIDTSGCGDADQKEAETIDLRREEQPLCLVVHTRESKKVTTPADKKKESGVSRQHSDPKSVTPTSTEKEIQDSFCGTHESDSFNSVTVTSSDECSKKSKSCQKLEEARMTVDKEREIKKRPKRKAPSNKKTGSDIEASTSNACLIFSESSLDAAKRDSMPSRWLDGSGDGQMSIETDQVSQATNVDLQQTTSTSESYTNHDNDMFGEGSGETPEHESHGALTLRDRHTMSSLPPKKRCFRKSPRHNNVNTSVVNRVVRGGGLQEKLSEIQQNKTKLSRGTNLHPGAGNKEKESTSSIAELDRGSRSRESKLTLPNSTISNSRALKRKQALSKKSHKNHRSRKLRGSEATESRKPEFAGKGDHDQAKSGGDSTRDQATSQPTKATFGSFKCPMTGCGASFSRKWTMDVHLDRVHMKNGVQLTCNVPLCSVKFSSRRELRQHIVEGHQGKVRRYSCNWPECGKGFFARTHLRTHMLVHTGEKPVACQLCDYRCRQSTALIWHMRKHGVYSQQKAVAKENGHAKTDVS